MTYRDRKDYPIREETAETLWEIITKIREVRETSDDKAKERELLRIQTLLAEARRKIQSGSY